MKCLPISEFPRSMSPFALTVEIQSSILAMRDRRRQRKSHEWVEASVCACGQVLRVKMEREGKLAIRWASAVGEPDVAIASVTPAGLSIDWMAELGLDIITGLACPTIPEPFSRRKDGVVAASIATDRSRGEIRPARFTADRFWVAADLLNIQRHTWVRIELYHDGAVWIGVPGRGRSLIGKLEESGVSLNVRDAVA